MIRLVSKFYICTILLLPLLSLQAFGDLTDLERDLETFVFGIAYDSNIDQEKSLQNLLKRLPQVTQQDDQQAILFFLGETTALIARGLQKRIDRVRNNEIFNGPSGAQLRSIEYAHNLGALERVLTISAAQLLLTLRGTPLPWTIKGRLRQSLSELNASIFGGFRSAEQLYFGPAAIDKFQQGIRHGGLHPDQVRIAMIEAGFSFDRIIQRKLHYPCYALLEHRYKKTF